MYQFWVSKTERYSIKINFEGNNPDFQSSKEYRETILGSYEEMLEDYGFRDFSIQIEEEN